VHAKLKGGGTGAAITPFGGPAMRFLATLTAGAAILALTTFTWSGALTAGEKGKAMLKVGDKAPTFESVDENGKAWKSSDHVGKKIVVLYFFPAATTGG
jgi:hypothetical protein